MKFKLAVPGHILTAHQISLVEEEIAAHVLASIVKRFPNWQERANAGNITGGEVILQVTDLTHPIKGLTSGIHVTISLVSYMDGRDFDGLAQDVIDIIKGTQDGNGVRFMKDVSVFVQLTLDRPVVKAGAGKQYSASGDGLSLLEYLG